MHDFDRQMVLRTINHDKELSAFYLNECNSNGGDIERALSITFLIGIVGVPKMTRLYESFFSPAREKELPASYVPDSEIVSRFRGMVKEFGWEDFILGLFHFATKKADQMKQLGLTSQADTWQANADKFKSLRKHVQL